MKSERTLATSAVFAAALGILVLGWTVGLSVVDAAGSAGSAATSRAGDSPGGPSGPEPTAVLARGSEPSAPAPKSAPASGRRVVVELVVWGTDPSGARRKRAALVQR